MNKQRRQQALEKCHQAETLLLRAREESKPQRLIARALDLYEEVLAMEDVKIAAPYLGISFLAFSAGEKDKALALLNLAKEIEPMNMKVIQMTHRINTARYVPPKLLKKKPRNVPTVAPNTAHFPTQQTSTTASNADKKPAIAPPAPPPSRITTVLGTQKSGKMYRGAQVELLQKFLIHIGKKDVQISGVFDAMTYRAIQGFQMAQSLPITGIVDQKTAQRINRTLASIYQKHQIQHLDELHIEATPVDIPEDVNELVVDLGPTDQAGVLSEGKQIYLLQRALNQMGHPVKITRVFDKATFMAVRACQAKQKIKITGVVEKKNREKLNQALQILYKEEAASQKIGNILNHYQLDILKKEASQEIENTLKRYIKRLLTVAQSTEATPEDTEETERYQPHRSPSQLIDAVLSTQGQHGIVSEGEMVVCLQDVLDHLGYPLKAHGRFDLETFTQVKLFQQSHHLSETGIVDGQTRTLINQHLQARQDQYRTEEQLFQVIEKFRVSLGFSDHPLVEQRIWKMIENMVRLVQEEPLTPDFIDEFGNLRIITSDIGPKLGQVNQGIEVMLVQTVLSHLGIEPVEVTEIYDKPTMSAVRALQMKFKLGMTGVVDGNTREVLNHELKDMFEKWRETQMSSVETVVSR